MECLFKKGGVLWASWYMTSLASDLGISLVVSLFVVLYVPIASFGASLREVVHSEWDYPCVLRIRTCPLEQGMTPCLWLFSQFCPYIRCSNQTHASE